MKRDHISTAVLAVLIAISLTMAPHPACAQSSGLVRGEVIDVDQSAGEITIRHGPMKKLGMDRGMTMVFRAGEPAMLKKVKAGDRVKFEALDVNGDYSVTRIEKVR
jgi:Cu(I)/Ag(I) efflux system protein CusF